MINNIWLTPQGIRRVDNNKNDKQSASPNGLSFTANILLRRDILLQPVLISILVVLHINDTISQIHCYAADRLSTSVISMPSTNY